MNRSRSFTNKLIYMAVIVLMLLPLYLLGQPATDATSNPGGQLTRMRSDLNLAEANLGEIDPASESMKLASLGLRGVAATLLWKKADDYKLLHEWDRLSATLNQIANLQPHYEKVWEHQAHNLSYNISVEFDDYRQRYAWIKKGMDFLAEGVRRNRLAPRLVWYTGWFYGQKLGVADEKVQFRELFRNDEPFHAQLKDEGIEVDGSEARGPDERPDNWLVGRLWYNRGYDLVDGGVPLVDKTPITFFESGPKSLIQYATAIEREGVLDDRSKSAWERSANDWYVYGTRSLPTTDGFTVQIALITDLYQRRKELLEQFETLVGPTLEKIRKQRRDALTPAAANALATPKSARTQDQSRIVFEVEQTLEPDYSFVAQQAPQEVQLRALEFAAEIAELDNRISKCNIYRDQMAYEYWELRCEAEQDDLLIDSRRLLYEAEQLYEETDLDGEIAKYEQAFQKWAEVYDKYPKLTSDVTADEVVDAINRYRVATDQSELASDFPLKDFYQRKMDEAEGIMQSEMELVAGADSTDTGVLKIDVTRPFTGVDRAPSAVPEPQTDSADEPIESSERDANATTPEAKPTNDEAADVDGAAAG